MAHFVLVHGAFHGAWCWDAVAQSLRESGHSVDAIDLPGSGSDATPIETVTLDSYRDRIISALEAAPEPVVLVGHSMGGIAITAASSAAPSLVSQLVYVAAFLPSDGETLLALTAKPEGAGDLVQSSMVVDGDPPIATMPHDSAIAAFYGECEPEVAELAAGKIGKQAVLPFFAPVSVDEATQPPRRFVLTLRDKSIPLPLQRLMSADNPCVETVELDTDHSPFLSKPAELSAILDRFAG